MKSPPNSYWKQNSNKINTNSNNSKEDSGKKNQIKVSILANSMNFTSSKLFSLSSSPGIIQYKTPSKHILNSFGLKRHHTCIKVFPSLFNINNSKQSINGINHKETSLTNDITNIQKKQVNTLNASLKNMKIFRNKEEVQLSVRSSPIYRNFFSSRDNNQKHYYYYIIRPENCGRIVKQCFDHRINWGEAQMSGSSQGLSGSSKGLNSAFSTLFNFKWQQNTFGINYGLLNKNASNKQIVNHFEFNSSISNKANLFMNMMRYTEGKEDELFRYIPLTILFYYDHPNFINKFYSFEQMVSNIQSHLCSMDYLRHKQFIRHFPYNTSFPFEDKLGSKTSLNIPHSYSNNRNLWIIKAPDLNRGHCIKVVNLVNDVKKCIKSFYEGIMKGYSCDKELDNHFDKEPKNIYTSKVVLLQKYLEKPLLYYNRKFDIRIWVLLTQEFQVHVFKEGHLKTCSINYDIDSLNKYSHLTNYSLQKKNTSFSKYEYGNEVSFEQFEDYLKQLRSEDAINFQEHIMKSIKNIIAMSFYSVKTKINSLDRKYCFELFGYDFILDNDLNPFLIEVNSNPGLEESSPLIKTLVPRMLDDALRLTVDQVFPTKYSFTKEEEMNIESRTINSNSYKKKRDICYQSPFPVKNYSNNDNMWEFICDLNKTDEQESTPMYKFRYKMHFGLHKVQK